MKKTVLITGGNGYIANSIHQYLSSTYTVTSISRNNFDLTDYDKTCEWFSKTPYDVVIHTAISGGSRLSQDDNSVFNNNMAMFDNLVANMHRFSKLITFGSGAEIFHGDTPYANSKREIAKQIEKYDNFYNLRIFALFDENELNTRFIKANLIRYLKKEPMVIHQNKIMDFFYMKDFITLVQHFIENDKLDKQINCSYSHKYSLKNIANFINVLGEHKVPIVIDNKDKFDFYCGDSELPIQTIGLHRGILNTYKCLLENNNYA
jgi:nucleoside-diphosphate-sugar epimerase